MIVEEQRTNNRQDKEEGVRAEREGEWRGEKREKTTVVYDCLYQLIQSYTNQYRKILT